MRSEQVMIIEGKEKGGNTTTREFFDVLTPISNAYTQVLSELHRTFPGLHDRWQILREK